MFYPADSQEETAFTNDFSSAITSTVNTNILTAIVLMGIFFLTGILCSDFLNSFVTSTIGFSTSFPQDHQQPKSLPTKSSPLMPICSGVSGASFSSLCLFGCIC